MNLIILTEADRVTDSTFRLADSRAAHIRSVLKLRVGDTVLVGLLNGPECTAEIVHTESGLIELKSGNWHEIALPKPEIDLICALPRPQTLKKVLLTCAMMGVRSLHLIRANRVERSYFQSPLVQTENQLPYLIEGLSQGKLTRLPQVTVHDRFRQFFEDELGQIEGDTEQKSLRLLCSQDTEATLDTVYDKGSDQMIIAVGPEGGWVPFETELMQSVGFRPFTLGCWTLRVEHAVTAALSQVGLLRAIQQSH
ncbi:MAG: RsmE family RNA methyltransferase [candidate division Zixibacteria bacterium]|nr:RsmE family RNA methyltransferase [candidate division Zixibacteria bacterium]